MWWCGAVWCGAVWCGPRGPCVACCVSWGGGVGSEVDPMPRVVPVMMHGRRKEAKLRASGVCGCSSVQLAPAVRVSGGQERSISGSSGGPKGLASLAPRPGHPGLQAAYNPCSRVFALAHACTCMLLEALIQDGSWPYPHSFNTTLIYIVHSVHTRYHNRCQSNPVAYFLLSLSPLVFCPQFPAVPWRFPPQALS